ncbi:MAG TPA: ABC transporter ATP-binding protein [Thermotogota bacterium]|nr:ABC transporter ATP-binding protein [Thermotogota bacterium]HRW92591.1 ABC transporter ATP-binding protein [Thermotogota bacterium]
MLALELQHVMAGYGKAIVLEDVCLALEEGKCLAVLGPNGAGKSTLLKTITATLHPLKGKVFFFSQEITRKRTFEIARMGMALSPENRRLFPDLSVRENLLAGAMYGPSAESHQREMQRVFAIFPRLEERQEQLAKTMSGGEQQMVAIARAMMLAPKVLLLDEPSMGLAHIVKEQIFEGIEKIKRTGKTILIVEQDATMVLPIADHVAILEHGNVVWNGSPDQIRKDKKIMKAYMGVE